MVFVLFEKYDSGESTAKFRLIQCIIDLIGIVISFAAFGFVYLLVEPKTRYLTCDMSDISFPYLPDTVPIYAVGLYGIIGPILIIILVEIYNAKLFPCQSNDDRTMRGKFRTFFIVTFHSLSLFLFGVGVQLLLTEIGKRWAGRLRPHFLAVCKHVFTAGECTLNGVYLSINTGGDFCTGEAKEIKEARLSFPSGHASFSTYTMLFLVIYLEARLVTLKYRAFKPLIQVAAISAAWVTCLSRIVDYYHRGSDVIGGAILGALVAIAFTCYFGRVLWDFDKRKKKTDFDLYEDE